jgi:hypothetical protein
MALTSGLQVAAELMAQSGLLMSGRSKYIPEFLESNLSKLEIECYLTRRWALPPRREQSPPEFAP